jgi:hypothetical protein
MKDIDYLEDFHEIGDTNCQECKRKSKEYPKLCSCGGGDSLLRILL